MMKYNTKNSEDTEIKHLDLLNPRTAILYGKALKLLGVFSDDEKSVTAEEFMDKLEKARKAVIYLIINGE